MYADDFKEAFARSKRLGLDTPDFKPRKKRFLTPKNLKKLPRIVEKAIGLPEPKDIFAKCHVIHWQLINPLSSFFKTNLVYTIGHYSFDSTVHFKNTEQEFENMINKGVCSSKLKIHTWLTLPSMEILDYALPTTIAMKSNLKELMGMVVSKHADELDESFQYYPMLVGEDFLGKSGIIWNPDDTSIENTDKFYNNLLRMAANKDDPMDIGFVKRGDKR